MTENNPSSQAEAGANPDYEIPELDLSDDDLELDAMGDGEAPLDLEADELPDDEMPSSKVDNHQDESKPSHSQSELVQQERPALTLVSATGLANSASAEHSSAIDRDEHINKRQAVKYDHPRTAVWEHNHEQVFIIGYYPADENLGLPMRYQISANPDLQIPPNDLEIIKQSAELALAA